MRSRRTASVVAAIAALGLIAGACGGDSNESAADSGGILVWAHEQEPPDLHLDDPTNNLTITAWIRAAMLEGLYGVSAATAFVPELLADEAEVSENADGSVTGTFTLRDGLSWSDGESLTADDVKFTFDIVMAQDGEDYIYLTSSREGLETITDFTVNSDTEFEITWSEFFAGYPALFSEIYPSHVFSDDPAVAAAEINEALREWNHDGETLPSSGPMVFESWNRGQNMTLARNDRYHGSTSPDVSNRGVAFVAGVDIQFVTDTDSQINALLAGEAQIVMTQPQTQFETLATDDKVTVASEAGPVFEHWGFNMFNKHLKKSEVREALALAIDKAEVMAGLYTPLFGDSLPAEGLGNVYWMSNQPDYVDHQGQAGYGAGDIDGAKAALESAGYVLGADGIYEHPEDGRLSLRVGTTGGNALREVQQQLLQAGFSKAGIEIVIDNVEGAAYFGAQPFNDDALDCAYSGGEEGNCEIWDIAQFAWVGGPWPGGQSPAFATGGGNNAYGYSNADFDAKASECDGIVDDAERADCYNELNRYLTTLELGDNGLVVLPLTQKPSFFVYSNVLEQAGKAPDANAAGPIVYVMDYKFK